MDSKLIDAAGGFLSRLTWKRVAMAFALLAMAGASVMFWINREYISGAIKPATLSPERQELAVSDNGKAAIEDTLKKNNSINTIFVVSMFLERNSRRVIFFRTNDPEIQRQRTDFEQTHATTDVPIFTDDIANNRRIIAYINGEFQCSEFKDTQAVRYLVNVNIKYVCATAIPPVYGKFTGTVVAMLTKVPDADEQTRLKILLRDLADKLYGSGGDK